MLLQTRPIAAVADLEPLREDMARWRHRLHRDPELAFAEHETAALVASELTALGLDVHTGIAGTGVVGILNSGQGDGAIGLRADMDGLPIEEENEFDHRSRRPGRMHACGHDGHTAMLLGAAKRLARHRAFRGTVYFIFQPAEENEGGARRMIDEGLFDRFPMRAVFGLHNMPGIPVGQFAVMPGPMMASFDVFEIAMRGRGGHAAFPHEGNDVIVASSELVLALQSIVSRSLDPMQSAVVSVTQLSAGDTWNVLPDSAALRGTVRAFDESVQTLIERRLIEIAEHVAAAHGATASIRYERRYPVTRNWPSESSEAQCVLRESFGESNVSINMTPLLAAEDFAFMLQARPGCYVWMGNGSMAERGALHSPRYDFNDDALVYGATYWCRLVERLLPLPGATASA